MARKALILYISVIMCCMVLVATILHQGSALTVKNLAQISGAINPQLTGATKNVFLSNLQHPLSLFLLEVTIIVVLSQCLGFLSKKIYQPVIVGEIMAGILLGPTFLGKYFPEAFEFLFNKNSLGGLQIFSQFGLMLFMFIVGMEVDMKSLRAVSGKATIISHVSILLPFVMGMFLAYFIYDGYAPHGVHFSSFALFCGMSLSVTAFPVLARIIKENKLSGTPAGDVSITGAAIGDITVWCILPLVIAIGKSADFNTAFITIGLAIVYVLFMLFVMKPVFNKLFKQVNREGAIKKRYISLVFIALFISSYLSDLMGIHLLFGAFLAGVIIPDNVKFRKLLTGKIEDLSLVILLPVFFALTGLKTEIGFLNNGGMFQLFLIISALAIIGKFVGAGVAAKVTGFTNKQSVIVGILMNTRGLMEVVILNIGLELNIITRELFTVMVLMAIITTIMAGPLLTLVQKKMKD